MQQSLRAPQPAGARRRFQQQAGRSTTARAHASAAAKSVSGTMKRLKDDKK
jgi:hypothetical protein